MEKEIKNLFLKSISFFVIGVILLSLFFWTLIQGLLLQISGSNTSLVYYLLSFLSGITAFYNYVKAKTIFHYVKLS